jgi:surface polysaccharide O-acyltransferase-like enzyme
MSRAPRADPIEPRGRSRTDIELIRIVASLAVVTIHVAGGMYDAAPEARETTCGVTSLVLNAASRFSVPAFFAVSGWSFLVASPIASMSALKARILRVIVPLFSWTLIYGVFANRHSLTLGAIPKVSWMFLTGVSVYHFWFLYAYVPLFLGMGLLTLVLRGQRRGVGFWLGIATLLLLAASTSLLDLAGSLANAPPSPSGWVAPPYAIAYALLGAGILSLKTTTRVMRIAGAAVYLVAVGASVAWSRYFGHVVPEDYGSIVTIAATVGALLLLVNLRFGPTSSRVIAIVGRASFGLYLVHLLAINLVVRLLAPIALLGRATGWGGFLRGPAHVLASFAIALLASLAWGRVPSLRRLLG